MPSKLGPHFIGTPGLERWLAARPGFYKFDPSSLGAAAQIPAGPLVVGKLDQREDRLNLTDWKAYYNQGWTPEQTAQQRFDAQRNIYVGANKPRVNRYEANSRIDVWEDDNEVVPDNAVEARWYSRYCIAMMQLYESIGKKRANFSFAVGTPDIRPGSADDIWPHLLPAIRYARDHGHYIALHEYMGYEAGYGVGWMQIDAERRPIAGRWHGRLAIHEPDESYPYGWTVLRYRFVYDTYLRPEGLADTPLLITECGCDSVQSVTPLGVSIGTWKEHRKAWAAEGKDPETHYASMLQWYDQRLREDAYVKGAAIFTVGSVGNWVNWDIAGTRVEESLLAYIAAEREQEDNPTTPQPPLTPTPVPTPVPSPPPVVSSVLGADVSKWQGVINWAKMKAKGIGFVFIRASYGLIEDERLNENAPGAKAAAMPYTLYQYYHPWDNPIKQAEFFLELIGRYGIDLPPVVDLEEPKNIPTDYGQQVAQFMYTLTNGLIALGLPPRIIIYTNYSYWKNVLRAPEWGASCDLWIAAWTTASKPAIPPPWKRWTFWQYTNEGDGRAYGVQSIRLDLNRWNGTAAELQAYLIPRPGEVPAPAQVKFEDALREAAKASKLIGRTPTFALEAAMLRDGYFPAGDEGRVTYSEVKYAYRLGENEGGAVRVYYCPEGKWSEVKHIPQQPTPERLRDVLWQAGQHSRLIERNTVAALDSWMTADGFFPIGNEKRLMHDGTSYAYQLAADKGGTERIYYCVSGRWGDIKWMALAVPVQTPPLPAPPVTQPKQIDLLPYLRGDGRIYIVRHPHGAQEDFQTHTEGDKFYQVKNEQYEAFRFDEQFIWRGIDTSPGPSPDYDTQRPGVLRYYKQFEPGQQWARWCPRRMAVGQTWTGPGHQVQFFYKDTCQTSAANSGPATNKVTLVARHAQKSWNGIAVKDVVELVSGTGERFFYGRNYGLIAWQSLWGESAIVGLVDRTPLQREVIRCL